MCRSKKYVSHSNDHIIEDEALYLNGSGRADTNKLQELCRATQMDRKLQIPSVFILRCRYFVLLCYGRVFALAARGSSPYKPFEAVPISPNLGKAIRMGNGTPNDDRKQRADGWLAIAGNIILPKCRVTHTNHFR